MPSTSGNPAVFVYPAESDILELRKRFRLKADGYLSRGTLLYILETVKDRYDKESFDDALAAKAAHILSHIVSSHPFVDGNKRTAFGAADLFLRLNQYMIAVDADSALEFIITVAAGEVNEAQVRSWTRQHLKKLE